MWFSGTQHFDSGIASNFWRWLCWSKWWLSPTPLKNMSSSDWIIIPAIGENKIHVPNHQPVISWYYMIFYDIMWGNIQFIITIDNYYCWSNHAVVMSVVVILTTNVGKWHVEVAWVYQQARQVQTKNKSKLGWTHPIIGKTCNGSKWLYLNLNGSIWFNTKSNKISRSIGRTTLTPKLSSPEVGIINFAHLGITTVIVMGGIPLSSHT